MQKSAACAFCDAVSETLSRVAAAALSLSAAAVHWRYLPHTLAAILLLGIGFPVWRSYCRWRRGWLSEMVKVEIRNMSISRSANRHGQNRPTLPALLRASYHNLFRGAAASTDYFFHRAWSQIRNSYVPSVTSFVAIAALLAVIALIPHPPKDLSVMGYPVKIWRYLNDDLPEEFDAISKILEGLIVVIIALIIFVAESIRNSSNADEKKVLLKISRLWLLILLITMTPLGWLYARPTGFTALVVVVTAFITIIGFGRVIHNLVNINANWGAQRDFLKARVHANILDSVRERVGNKLLFRIVGENKDVNLNFSIVASQPPGGADQYVFIDAPVDGMLSDINIALLKDLAQYCRREQQRRVAVSGAGRQGGPAGTPITPGQARPPVAKSEVYLLRRFREALPEDTIFSRGNSILALRKDLVEGNPRMVDEVRGRVRQAFRFSRAESASLEFRREMQSTKDRLAGAIRSAAMGEVEELTATYMLVAEEFLTTLNELGGGYTAEQARNERGALFQGWNEVRWLVSDIRELIMVASDTDNANVIEKISYLPYAIAARAIQAGDHLLFQELLAFATFIYWLAAAKPLSSSARSIMIERSWRFLKELSDFYVQPLFKESMSRG
jgi:hypothetical protein